VVVAVELGLCGRLSTLPLVTSSKCYAFVFDGRFSVQLSFRALQPDGVVLTMLSSESIASQYFIVSLRGGHVVVSMATSNGSGNTLSVISKYRYNDAYWWQVQYQYHYCVPVAGPGNLMTDVPQWSAPVGGLGIKSSKS